MSVRPRHNEQAATAAVLLDALGKPGPPPPEADRVDPHRLAKVARWHGIEGYVLAYLLERGHDPATLGELEVACRTTAVAHLRKVADLHALQQILAAASIDVLVVKGPVVAETLHGSATLRGYEDLDLVVAPADFRSAVTSLEAAGVQVLDRNWDRLVRERRGQCHLLTDRDTIVDLHWHLINDADLRAVIDLRTEALFARSVTAPIGRLGVATTDPVDTLLHLCIHATMAGGDRLIWFKDIERAVAATTDWDEVVRRSAAWGSDLPVGMALQGAVRLLDAPVPGEVLRGLASSRTWRWVNVVSSRLSPPEQLDGGGALYRMVGRSTRRDLSSSLAELARRGVRHVPWLPGREAEGDIFDAGGPDSLHHPAGDREAYFALVAGQVDPG